MNETTNVKRLVRSRTDRKLTGACAGIGDYFGVDANVIRLITVLLVIFTGGTAAIAYILAALLMPEA